MRRTALPERAARAALAAHFTPAQVADELVNRTPEEVWIRHVERDRTGHLTQYRPRAELAHAQLVSPFLIPSDEGWPHALGALGSACPLGLWVRGAARLPRLLAAAPVAVTGGHAVQTETRQQAGAFATRIALAGHTVVSTLGYGVDAAALRAALRAGRPPLAVLPRGLDRAHPHTHAALLTAVEMRGGAVVSLHRPGTSASGRTLHESAEFMAALAECVLLINGTDHSPAKHTAKTAHALGRKVLAAPGSSPGSGNQNVPTGPPTTVCGSPDQALALL